MKDINNIILNPTRMRIIQNLSTKKSITTNELCELMSDIPRTTLYRHVKILIDNDILEVVAENKVRGSVERTISLNLNTLTSQNTVDNLAQNAFGFLMNIYAKFQDSLATEKSEIKNQKIFLVNSVLMMNDEEFDSYLLELNALFQKYNLKASDDRKPRDISIISAPVNSSN